MKTNRNIQNQNLDLLAKYLSDEAGGSEKQQVEDWSGQTEENRTLLHQGRLIFSRTHLWFETQRFDSDAAWQKVKGKLHRETPVVRLKTAISGRRWMHAMIRAAAVIILAVALGITGYYLGFRQHKPAVYTEVVSAARQVVPEITLPDGSVVSLNGSSKLTYPKEFAGGVREVSIEGEAFFAVEADPSRPFVITAGNTRIRVLGTSFNVCAYPEQDRVEVVVESGKVQVTSGAGNAQPEGELLLSQGEKGTFSMRDNSLTRTQNSDLNAYAWKTRMLVFNETPLSEVVRVLEKVYHTEIQLSEPSVRDLLLTANFNAQPVDFILDVVRLTFDLELTSGNDQYFLTSRKNF